MYKYDNLRQTNESRKWLARRHREMIQRNVNTVTVLNRKGLRYEKKQIDPNDSKKEGGGKREMDKKVMEIESEPDWDRNKDK